MAQSRDNPDTGTSMTGNIDALISVLDRERPVLVQTHDFPDHDAVGAAYALCELLLRRRFACAMTYGGMIQSISLASMIDRLEIKFTPFEKAQASTDWQTITVDGSPAAGTVRAVAGNLIAVIDHHPARKKLSCPFADVRTACGSCSAIVWTYWRDAGEEPDRTTATALLAGIQLDTDFLSRHVSETDLDAHYDLFFRGSNDLAREVVRTSLSVDQLGGIGGAFNSYLVRDSALITEIAGDYSVELLSVLADFLLRLREVTFVVVIGITGAGHRLSARSRDHAIDAGRVIRHALAGIGQGGGHPHMAGGFIKPDRYPGKEAFFARITDEIASCRSKNETDNQAY